MDNIPAAAPVRSPYRCAYASEARFGVVMYGGVSLAIYINGVANELYEMCCATPKVDGEAPAENSTRAVYRRLSWLLRNPELRSQYLAFTDGRGDDPFDAACNPKDTLLRNDRQRFVVDVIAGTSAGGINGIFLAKALANGEAFAPLKDLWVKEGDIASLLNDRSSYDDIGYARDEGPPRSLLNSDRMYLKLLQAMEAMKSAVPAIGQGESALSDELDLFVTTTDIRGTVVPLRLFDNVVYEKRHKQMVHFNYAAADGRALANDFRPENNALLAFSARCTSSFPFAFEPMQVADAVRLYKARPNAGPLQLDDWKPYFTGLSNAEMRGDGWQKRAFGDGGYLDNKPFSYAVEALSWRLASVPMERKLIYVEPAPSHPERERQDNQDKPDAIENAVAALTKIPQYETIREDLEAVLKRNRRIERVERIVRKVEADVDSMEDEPFDRVMIRRNPNGEDRADVPDWSQLDLGRMIDYYGAAFLPYWRLRLTTVSDDLADRLADRWGVDRRSDRMYAMRALVRAWREREYYEHTPKEPQAAQDPRKSVNAFLAGFDIKYRVRRAGFLLRRTHQLLRLVQRRLKPDAVWPAESDAETALRERLQRRVAGFDTMRPQAWHDGLLALRDHLALAQADLRRIAWPPGANTERSGSDEERSQLDRVLALLMGEEPNPPLDGLPSHADPAAQVPLRLQAMPLPSPVRTLQENVHARAAELFRAADVGRLTRLQHLLQADLDDLRQRYIQATGAGRSGTAQALLTKELLGVGYPALLPVPAPTADKPDKLRIEINLEDVKDARVADTLNTREGRALRLFLAEYYLRFDEYDQVSFPLYYDTGTGEPSTVEVVRVSPEDAPSLIDERPDQGDTGDKGRQPGKLPKKRRKLAGTFLFNFGGFLDEQWRRNDIMWGRLDACERLLATLLPAINGADPQVQKDQDRLRAALLGQAQRAILKQEMTQPYYAELLQRFSQALQSQGDKSLEKNFETLLQALNLQDGQSGTRWALALKAVFEDEGLFEFVQKHYEVRRDLDTETALKTGARALTITGRILQQIETRKRGGGSHAVWVTRAGRALQALLVVATPGGLARRFWKHWLKLLYAFEIAVALGALLLSEPATRNFALSAFGITLVLHLATLVTGDLMRRRYGWAITVAGTVGAGVLVVALLGAVGLARHGAVSLLCGPIEAPPEGVAGWVCERLEGLRPAATSRTAANGRGSS